MKNTLILMFLLAMFVGCKKKEFVKDILPAAGTPNGQRIDPENMEDAMNSFITLTLENNVGECDDYEAEDALLIMEAALNYTTCTPTSDYDEVEPDTFDFEMNLALDEMSGNGEFIFSADQMETVWPEILAAIQAAHQNVSFADPNDPFNIIVDLEFTLFDRQSQSSTQTALVQVITWVGNVPLDDINCEWDSTDYWLAMGPNTGHGCGSNSSNTSSWAVKEIQKRLSPKCRGVSACGYLSYVATVLLSPYFNYTGCGLGSFTVTWFPPTYYPHLWAGMQDQCLTPYDLNSETNGIKCLAAYYNPNPGNFIIMSYKLQVTPQNGGPYYAWHYCHVKYGVCSTYIQE